MKYKRLDVKCSECNNIFNICIRLYNKKNRLNEPLKCDDCVKIYKQEIVQIKCKKCNKSIDTKRGYLLKIKWRGGKMCRECRCQKHSDTMKKTMTAMTPEERKANGAYGRSCVSPDVCSAGVKKQWETIRADKDLYKKVCDARAGRSKKMWEERSPEERDRIIKTLVSSQNCTRSKFSESVKKAMQDSVLYDGFVSEEVFHGFIPDEINHDLKMIVEMYGDLYHCNPRKYKNPDLYIKTINRTVGEQWKRDRRRLACFYKHGYNVVIVWERDFRNRPQEVIERIKDEINKKRTS